MIKPTRVIDTHLHLDDRAANGDLQKAVEDLDRQVKQSGVARVVILHLLSQGWSAVETANALKKYPQLKAFVQVHPFEKNCLHDFDHAIDKLGFIGLKLHPRLQEFDISDPRVKKLCQHAGDKGVPVLV